MARRNKSGMRLARYSRLGPLGVPAAGRGRRSGLAGSTSPVWDSSAASAVICSPEAGATNVYVASAAGKAIGACTTVLRVSLKPRTPTTAAARLNIENRPHPMVCCWLSEPSAPPVAAATSTYGITLEVGLAARLVEVFAVAMLLRLAADGVAAGGAACGLTLTVEGSRSSPT